MPVSIPKIGELRQRIFVTTKILYPDSDEKEHRYIDERQVVLNTRAKIQPVSLNKSPFAVIGYQHETKEGGAPTHYVYMRNPSDYMVCSKNYLFYEFKKRRRWLKVNSAMPIDEKEKWLVLYCQIEDVDDPRADPATYSRAANFKTPFEFE